MSMLSPVFAVAIMKPIVSIISEALFYTGCDTPFQGPSLGRPILGASNHGYFSFLAFYVDFCLLV